MIKWLIAIMIMLMVIAIIILSMIEERATEIRTYVRSINLSVIQKNTPRSGSIAQKPMTEVRYSTLYMLACNMLDHLSAGTEHAKTQKEWMRFFEEAIK